MKLSVRIFHDEQGGYTAVVPSLPGCCSRGVTREEARRSIDEAIRGYIAALTNSEPDYVVQELIEAEA